MILIDHSQGNFIESLKEKVNIYIFYFSVWHIALIITFIREDTTEKNEIDYSDYLAISIMPTLASPVKASWGKAYLRWSCHSSSDNHYGYYYQLRAEYSPSAKQYKSCFLYKRIHLICSYKREYSRYIFGS